MAIVEILALLTGGLLGLGVLEQAVHRRALRAIPWRIHVSGTRGKSSVTRLIRAGLEAGGVTALGKTTGSSARVIVPDGDELPLFRPLGASLGEQRRVAALAARLGVRALVVECMALTPRYHWISERHFVRATVGVITNIRPDHLEMMGPTEADVARAIASMIPVGGVLYTAERRHLPILAAAAKDRGTRLVAVTEEEVAQVTVAELRGFPYIEHAANLALALRVVTDLGVPRATALSGMQAARPDVGALREYVLTYFGREVVLVAGFAANDPVSTRDLWLMTERRHPEAQRRIALFNLRADRAARSEQLARECDFLLEADGVVLMGDGAQLFARLLEKQGFDMHRVTLTPSEAPAAVFECVLALCAAQTVVVGMGNIGGAGLALMEYFQHRARGTEASA